MTRKDYVAIAQCIGERITPMLCAPHYHANALAALKGVAIDIAATMAAGNPRFDRARFLKACGVQS